MQELITKTAELKIAYLQAQTTARDLKNEYEAARLMLQRHMESVGAKTAEAGNVLAIKTHRTNIEVIDEAAAIDWLSHQDVDMEVYVGLKKVAFTPLAKLALKRDGEVPTGCELKSEEYVTLKINGQKEDEDV